MASPDSASTCSSDLESVATTVSSSFPSISVAKTSVERSSSLVSIVSAMASLDSASTCSSDLESVATTVSSSFPSISVATTSVERSSSLVSIVSAMVSLDSASTCSSESLFDTIEAKFSLTSIISEILFSEI